MEYSIKFYYKEECHFCIMLQQVINLLKVFIDLPIVKIKEESEEVPRLEYYKEKLNIIIIKGLPLTTDTEFIQLLIADHILRGVFDTTNDASIHKIREKIYQIYQYNEPQFAYSVSQINNIDTLQQLKEQYKCEAKTKLITRRIEVLKHELGNNIAKV